LLDAIDSEILVSQGHLISVGGEALSVSDNLIREGGRKENKLDVSRKASEKN
jgi:hypothetical protein